MFRQGQRRCRPLSSIQLGDRNQSPKPDQSRSLKMTKTISPSELQGSQELVAASPDPIMQLGLAFWGSKTLLSAVELGLFTHLADGPLSLEALAARTGLHDRCARDFLDALVALGMLGRSEDQYANTPAT